MNTIKKINDRYVLIVDDKSYECKKWLEKKTQRWYVVLPQPNPTGRTFISLNKVEETGSYEFENKTTGARVLGASWKSRLTPDERNTLDKLIMQRDQAQEQIDRLKEIASKREPVKLDKDSPEYIQAEIEKLQARLLQAKLKNKEKEAREM